MAERPSALPLASSGALLIEDLNYLYQRQQVSLMAAESSATGSGRAAHRALARAYGRRIDQARAACQTADHNAEF